MKKTNKDQRDAIDLSTVNVFALFRKYFIPTLLGMVSISAVTVVDGIFVGLPGYKLKITGGSDGNGTPMRKDLPGNRRRKLLLAESLGFHEKYPGQRKRTAIHGAVISDRIVQINMAVTEYGPKSIEESLAPEAPSE